MKLDSEQKALLLGLLHDEFMGNNCNSITEYRLHSIELVQQHRLSYTGLPSLHVQKRIDSNGVLSFEIFYDDDHCFIVYGPTSATIHYFPHDESITLGSIYTYVSNLWLDDQKLLRPIFINQLLSTYKKTNPWQLQIEHGLTRSIEPVGDLRLTRSIGTDGAFLMKSNGAFGSPLDCRRLTDGAFLMQSNDGRRRLRPNIPSCIIDIIVDYYGHQEGIERECKEIQLVYVIALLIKQFFQMCENFEQTIETFLADRVVKQNIEKYFLVKRESMSDQNISFLSIQEQIHEILIFCGISDVEFTNDIIKELETINSIPERKRLPKRRRE